MLNLSVSILPEYWVVSAMCNDNLPFLEIEIFLIGHHTALFSDINNKSLNMVTTMYYALNIATLVLAPLTFEQASIAINLNMLVHVSRYRTALIYVIVTIIG